MAEPDQIDMMREDDLREELRKVLFARETLRDAIKPFAEQPTEYMDTFPCHNGITTKEKCGRCGRAIAAWNALKF
ncbi:MAG: hypothetical protein HGB12_13010 [Bacteroidetes bacterium]|nr:hypothetical protein [Bacteroidota bacterium]